METKKRMNTLSFQDAEIEAEVLKMVEASNGTLSKSKAIVELFRKLKEQTLSNGSELSDKLRKNNEDLKVDLELLRERHKLIVDSFAGLEAEKNSYRDELEALKESLNNPSEKVLIHTDDFETPEAFNYFKLVLTEIEALELHKTRGAFILNMLRVMQVAHKGYVPATNQITEESWCK